MVKNILQIPDQADCFIVRCWFLLFQKWRLTQLLHECIDFASIILNHGAGKIIDNTQYRTRIKLGRVGGQYEPHGIVF